MGREPKLTGSTPVGDRLKKERIRRGYHSAAMFACVLGVPSSQITRIENQGRLPSVPFLITICTELDCSTDWLLGLET